MPHSNPSSQLSAQTQRLGTIARARETLLFGRGTSGHALVPVWVERSWQRCLAHGLQPDQCADFDLISPQHVRRILDASQSLVQTAQPMLDTLGKAIANTGYFALLTDHEGIVVGVSGCIDRSDRRADLITRIGTDLSESRVGTTAIGTALTEHQPVWLHRGEHFFANTASYSCAGAPLFGPNGRCIGMLDLTGIDAVERHELKHLVTQVAGKIENALVLAQSHVLTVRLNWPGNTMGSDADGILCLDADGWITGANQTARHMVSKLPAGDETVHVSDVFGVPYEMLFDAARRSYPVVEVPLWTGLQLQALALERAHETDPGHRDIALAQRDTGPLRDIETALIHRAVEQARGNVAQAALALGISRATVYRKLGRKPSH